MGNDEALEAGSAREHSGKRTINPFAVFFVTIQTIRY